MRWRRIAVGGLVVLLVLGAGGYGALRYAEQAFVAPGPLRQASNVAVPHGSPVDVAGALRQAGVIDDIRGFRVATAVTTHEGPLRAAEFSFPANASLRQVLTILRTARPVQHRVTIPEGLTAGQIAVLLDRIDLLSGDPAMPGEGEVLPQSYAYELGATRTALVERASAAMQKALAEVWAERSPGLPLASPHDLVTMASIVERETARPEERPHVAAVLLNRLRLGMKLQSDPTVTYAVTGGMGPFDRRLTRADLDQPNPYNTYAVAGLPPGPIGSPGLAAMRAVARPLDSDDLYFVADGNGGHAFARTLEDHNRNVARWRALAVPTR